MAQGVAQLALQDIVDLLGQELADKQVLTSPSALIRFLNDVEKEVSQGGGSFDDPSLEPSLRLGTASLQRLPQPISRQDLLLALSEILETNWRDLRSSFPDLPDAAAGEAYEAMLQARYAQDRSSASTALDTLVEKLQTLAEAEKDQTEEAQKEAEETPATVGEEKANSTDDDDDDDSPSRETSQNTEEEGGAAGAAAVATELIEPTDPAEEPTPEPDAKRASQQKSLWLEQLQRLDRLSDAVTTATDPATVSSLVSSLAGVARRYFEVRGSLARLDDVFQALNNLEFPLWTQNLTPDEIDEALSVLSETITAADQLLTQTDRQLTPGEAAALAKEAAAQAQPPAAAATAPDELAETEATLADIGKFSRAQHTLTQLSRSILEDELRKIPNISEAEIQQFLAENQEALNQQLLTLYLETLQRQPSDRPLDIASLARLAIGTSAFFAEKYKLEHFISNGPILPSVARNAMDGDLSPDVLAKLRLVAAEYGYDTEDALFAALFAGDNARAAQERFIRLATESASFDASKIAEFSRGLIRKQLGVTGNSNDGLVERFMASLDQDQNGFRQFILQRDAADLPPELKRKWQRLVILMLKHQRSPLAGKELQEAEAILLQIAPMINLLQTGGDQIYALRQGVPAMNRQSAMLHRTGQQEQQLMRHFNPGGQRTMVPVVPPAFSSAAFAKLAAQEERQVQNNSLRISAQLDLAAMRMITQRLADQGVADEMTLNQAYAQLALQQAGEQGAVNNLGELQRSRGMAWSQRLTHLTGGENGHAMVDLAARAAGGAGGKTGIKLFGGLLKNPWVVKTIITVGTGAVGAFATALPVIAAAMALPFVAVGSVVLLDRVLGAAINIFKPLFSGGTAVSTGIPVGGASTTLGKAAIAGGQDAASQLMANAKILGGQQLQNAGSVVGQAGSRAGLILDATTTQTQATWAMAGAAVATPFMSIFVLTMIVWMVIGNSMNDNSSGALSTRLGIGGCWPTEGRLTVTRYYNGNVNTPHATWLGQGTAIDIGQGDAPDAPMIITPFAGQAVSKFDGAYGIHVRLQTAMGFELIFAHMDAVTIGSGTQMLQAGQEIGVMGSTGNSSGNHLHYELFDTSGRGREIFDILPIPESQLTYLMPIRFSQCVAKPLPVIATPEAELAP